MGALALTVLASLSQPTCAQAGDAIDRLKACARFEGMERLKCVDELLGEVAEPTAPAPPRGPNWIISETTSPVDYKPQIAAQTMGRAAVEGCALLARHPLSRQSHRADNFHNAILEAASGG